MTPPPELNVELPQTGEAILFSEGTFRRAAPDEFSDSLIFPGSFDPFHVGHRELAAAATRASGRNVICELSVTNAEKRSLTTARVRHRLNQFTDQPVVLTAAPLFLQKSRLFAGCRFLVGIDTARRILDPRFYDGSKNKMAQCLNQLRNAGHTFLVGGRVESGDFCTMDSLRFSASCRGLFHQIPESDFRRDISSTELRRHRKLEAGNRR